MDIARFHFTLANFELQEFMMRNLLKAFDKRKEWQAKRTCKILIEFSSSGNSVTCNNQSINLKSQYNLNDLMASSHAIDEEDVSAKGINI